MADFFEEKIAPSLKYVSKELNAPVEVPKERQFVGLDGYKKAIDAIGPGGVVLLATPPAFRPIHVEYARGEGLPRVHGKIVRGRLLPACAAYSKPARKPRRRTSKSPAG